MLTEERKQRILHLLETQTIVKSQELIQMLDASESTIRRDLQELEDDALLERVHGGAKKNQKLSLEPNMDEKTFKNVQQKKTIAQLAVFDIHDEDVIYLDAGTTTLELIPLLAGKKISAVTNSVRHATALVEIGIPTMILGGSIKLSTNAVLGATAIQQLSQLRFNKAIMGMNGVHAQFGFTTPDPEEAAVKRTAMECSEESFVLADHSKMNQITFTKVADINKATIVTDYCPKDFIEEFQQQTIIKEAEK